MTCCGDNEDYATKKVSFTKNRSCTDIIFFLLFLASIGVSIVILMRARSLGGSPYAATHGRNFNADACGMGEYQDKKYAAWPIQPIVSTTVTPAQAAEYYNIKVCVASCNETNQQDNPNFLEPYESVVFWRFCMPKVAEKLTPDSIPYIDSDATTRAISDLFVTWKIIACSVGGAILIAFIYTKLMSFKCLRTVLIWGCILAVLALSAVISWQLIAWSKTVENHPLDTFDRAKAAKICGWVMVGITVILFLIIAVLRKRINFALTVIGSTSCALSQMRSMFLYPLVPIIFALGYASYWVFTALYIFTIGEKSTHPLPAAFDTIPTFAALTTKTYITLKWNTTFKWAFVYHFFHLLWMNQFFSYAAYLTIAGAIGQWYFSRPRNGTSDRDKERGTGDGQLSYFPITTSAWRVVRYHIGTVAFAALIIAIFQFIRAVITYIQQKTKGRDNRLVRCVLCCIKCCLYCVQKCIDYISRQALVVTAINGTNFCHSAVTAFGLLASNILRVTAFNIIATFVMFIGKLFISIATTTVAWLVMSKVIFVGERADDISSPIFPLILIFLLSWAIASMFMHIYNVSLECMFICYLADKDGLFTPAKIKKTFQKVEAREKAIEDERKQHLLSNTSNSSYELTPKQQSYYGSGAVDNNTKYDPYARK